jgi:hypothetical protein
MLTKCVFVLSAEHQYTESNLCFELLKGRDKGKLLALSTCPELDAHLVLVTRTVTGGTVRHAMHTQQPTNMHLSCLPARCITRFAGLDAHLVLVVRIVTGLEAR